MIAERYFQSKPRTVSKLRWRELQKPRSQRKPKGPPIPFSALYAVAWGAGDNIVVLPSVRLFSAASGTQFYEYHGVNASAGQLELFT